MIPSQMDSGSWITGQFSGSTYMPNNMDVQHEPLYDTLWNSATNAPFAAGATIPNLAQFFTAPVGKTLAQTNVTTAKRLDAPEAFAVMGIRLRFAENILVADALQLYNLFCLEFWIGQKSYNRAPLWFYVAGGGLFGFTAVATVTSTSNGLPGRNAMHALQINIVIDNQAAFFGQLDGQNVTLTTSSNGGTGANLMMLLDGLHARGVQ
jgi:hypothetical protein